MLQCEQKLRYYDPMDDTEVGQHGAKQRTDAGGADAKTNFQADEAY
jgi:hypothetical protein